MFCSHISYFYSSLHDREGFISVSNVWFPYSCDQNTNQGLRAFVSLLWFLYMSAANKLDNVSEIEGEFAGHLLP